jgi:hypothetical protein
MVHFGNILHKCLLIIEWIGKSLLISFIENEVPVL